MRLFPRWHTPESVARQLIEGLENGTLTLGHDEEEAGGRPAAQLEEHDADQWTDGEVEAPLLGRRRFAQT